MAIETSTTRQFLLVYDRKRDFLAEQRDFGADMDAAVDAFRVAELRYQDQPEMDIVLIGSDSIETIKRTHSTYFKGFSSQVLEDIRAPLEQQLIRQSA